MIMNKRKESLLRRMTAVLLSAVLLIVTVSNAVPITVLAQEGDALRSVAGEITSAMTWADGSTVSEVTIKGGDSEESPVVITVEGSVTVTGTITVSSGYVRFTGGGSLNWESSSYIYHAIVVQEGADAAFENVILDGSKVNEFSYSAFLFQGTGTFGNGTKVRNFASRTNSGAFAGYKGVIAVYEKGSLIITEGATITGNCCTSGIITIYQSDTGGGESTASVTMSGGTIEGNIVNNSSLGVIWNWCGKLNISGGTVTAAGNEYAVHTQGNRDAYDATTVISGGIFTGNELGAVCAGKDSTNNSRITIRGGTFTGAIAATANYGVINIEGGSFTGNTHALQTLNTGAALHVAGGEFYGETSAYRGNVTTTTEKVNVGTDKESAKGWDRSANLNTYKYVAIGELAEQPGDDGKHEHNGMTFTSWTETDSLPTDAGNYYLAENVTLSGTWEVPSGTTTLCLNGKTISASGDYCVITIPGFSTLHLYDCQNAGNITGGQRCGVRNSGTLYMYGGRISGNGGTKYYAGGIYTVNTFHMYGGEISGNHSTDFPGGGVYMAGGIFTVGGSAVISGNTYNGKENNVYLNNGYTIELDSSEPLSGSAYIGVTTATAPTEGSPVSVTGHNKGDYSRYFHSDNPDYEIVNTNDVVQLVAPVPASDTQPPTGEIKIEDNSWTSFLNAITFGLLFKEAKNVTITAQDEGSGVDKIYYYISDSVMTEAQVEKNLGADEWTEGTSFSITPDRKCVIYAKIIDKAGNEIYLSSDGLVFDGAPPVISGVMDGETYNTPQTVTVTDALSGVKNVTVDGTEVPLTDDHFTLGTADGQRIIAAMDRAGNTTTVRVTVKAKEQSGTVIPEVKTGDNAPVAGISTPAEELQDILLTDEEKQQVQSGTDIRIVLEMQDAENTVNSSEQAAIQQALNGFAVGQYLHIDLYKLVGTDRTDISETKKKIRIVITVPDRLKNADSSMTRTFAVIRVHDDGAMFLPDLDDSADTITIETDRFSTYAIVYKDTANDSGGNSGDDDNHGGGTDNGNNGNDNSSSDSSSPNNSDEKDAKPDSSKDNEPKTGDSAPLELYATLAMIAGFTYLLLYFSDRNRGMTEETKRELVSRLVAWAKQGGNLRKYLALAAIFVLLVYYHSIGKKMCIEWREIYGE